MFIGRKKEQSELLAYYESARPEFLAVYGRRRVGKTYLIKQFFKNSFAFYTTGVANATKAEQLNNFNSALNNYGGECQVPPTDWFEAFNRLRKLLEIDRTPNKKVVFIDELPWLDTPKSKFISALELFWNGWADSRQDILLIVCGSASSWMLNKLIRNHGGLYGRVTQVMRLNTFTLAECKEFFEVNNMAFTDYQVLESYMVFGGVPYYLNMMNNALSLSQNIDRLCFVDNARLEHEFFELFASLFKEPERHEAIVRALSSKTIGLSRDDILTITNLTDGGSFTKAIDELEVSGFVRKYHSIGKKSRNSMYQLTDFFTAFYLRFIENNPGGEQDYWVKFSMTAAHGAWSGYAFEQVCLYHIEQIKRKLGISGIIASVNSWRSLDSGSKAQVDLVIDRSDNVINLCEIKYANSDYTIDKDEDSRLRNRAALFARETKTRKSVRTVMITTYGIKKNSYSNNYPIEVTAKDLLDEA